MGVISNTMHGKRGELRMLFELDSEGRSLLRDLYRRAPIIVQQALYFDEMMPALPCVYILSAGGPVVEGDDYMHHITLGEGSCAHISTGAATKVAQMSDGRARLKQRFELHDRAYMEYLPEMTIPCGGACYEVECEAVVAPSATLFFSDIYTCGRRFSDERYRYRRLDLTTRIMRPDGGLLFCERQLVEPTRYSVEGVGVMSGMDIFASAIVVAPQDIIHSLYADVVPYQQADIALGVHLLPNDAGLMFRIMGSESAAVKSLVRELCSLVRQRVHGVTLPKEFVWR